jgi:2-polyprenyl-6-methoxyphenol hydroxylase-like FAD-dependent oxidoreductase
MLVIGDAICSFTPIYGQGMSTAAMEVVVLRECLAAGSKDLAPRFFKQAARVIDIPWTLTVGNDRRLSGAKQPAPKRIINWYMGKLQRAARQDPELALAFQKVTNLFAAPSSLLHPRLAWRVLRGNLTLDTGKIAYPVQQMPINPRQ